MDNQQQSVIGAQYEVGQLNGSLILLEKNLDTNKYKVRCNNCDATYVVSLSTLSRNRKDDLPYCKHCKPKIHKSSKYKAGNVISCFEFIEFEGGNYWSVKCTKCGKIQKQSIPNMKKRKKDECVYCTNPDYKRNYNGGGGVVKYSLDERVYVNYKSKISSNNKNANKKYKEWDLSLEQFTQLVHQDCFYCGSEPSPDNRWNQSGKRKTQINEVAKYNGIDRTDSNRGYIFDNCVPCCKICNRMKSDLTTESFYDHINKIISNKQ